MTFINFDKNHVNFTKFTSQNFDFVTFVTKKPFRFTERFFDKIFYEQFIWNVLLLQPDLSGIINHRFIVKNKNYEINPFFLWLEKLWQKKIDFVEPLR